VTESAHSIETDILIIGAGPVGMTLALRLHSERSPLRVLLLDRRARDGHLQDPRALALAHGTRQLLEPLGAWNGRAATAIHDIHVSQSGGFGRTLLTREESGVPALGYVMRYRDLATVLAAALPAGAVLDRCEIGTIADDDNGVTLLARRNGAALTVRSRLLVHADGTPEDSGDVFVADYRQHAVIAEVRTESAHGHRAWERFTPDGPLALLPLGKDYSVVFTVPAERSEGLTAMSDADFLATLQRQFGERLRFVATSSRSRFPLALRLRRELTDGRRVWIGNAAQTLHPVSGQGFNLGIRDAVELAECLSWPPDDAGDAGKLNAYAHGRQNDRFGAAAFTDGIVRTFSNRLSLLKAARGVGLLALDLVPPARRFVAQRMLFGARGW